MPPSVPIHKRPIVVITVAAILILTVWRLAALKKKEPEPATPAADASKPVVQAPVAEDTSPPPSAQPVEQADAAPAPAAKIVRDRSGADRLRASIARARASRAPAPSPAGAGRATASGEHEPGLSKDYIRDQVRAILPLLTECYSQALERDPKLGGRIMVKFEISGEPDLGGAVASSEVDEDDSTALEPEFVECVQETMYAAEFKPPSDGGDITVSYPFEFRSEQ
jgi:outer membrane biosynthesis protein TonB